MDIYENWIKALKNTEIIRPRVKALQTFENTGVSYILLSPSSVNAGDTVVRKGQVTVERPQLILPPYNPQFLGFEFDDDTAFKENSIINFLLVRGINLPSYKYDNHTSSMDIYEGDIKRAIAFYREHLQRTEDVQAGLISGPNDCWQFSLLIYICTQAARNLESDIRKLLDEYHREKDH